MAIKATIFKVELSIADMDKHYYQDHQLTIARHPSETDERMMLRVLAFIINAHEQLAFTKGLSAVDEPELWQKNYSDEIELWVDLGQPSEQRVKKACNQSQQVIIYTYGGNVADEWLKQESAKLSKRKNLTVYNVLPELSETLSQWVTRTMQIQASIQDGQVWLTCGDNSLEATPTKCEL